MYGLCFAMMLFVSWIAHTIEKPMYILATTIGGAYMLAKAVSFWTGGWVSVEEMFNFKNKTAMTLISQMKTAFTNY